MQCLCYSPRQLLLSSITAASAPPRPRWWPSPRNSLTAASSPSPDHRLLPAIISRFASTSIMVKVEEQCKPDRSHCLFSYGPYGVDCPTNAEKDVIDTVCGDEHRTRCTKEVIAWDGDGCPGDGDEEDVRVATDSEGHERRISDSGKDEGTATSSEEDGWYSEEGEEMVIDSEDDGENNSCYNPTDAVVKADIVEDSTHRDGSIYKEIYGWQICYRIADLDEARLEALRLSGPKHKTCPMLQFSSLKLAEIVVTSGPVELYGYLAARDRLDPLRNYIVNISRDDPIITEKGSLIKMSGPKRGIEMLSTVLLEFDMKIKTGAEQEYDLQLIDGVTAISELSTPGDDTFRNRIYGDCSAVDIEVAHLFTAVEATVEVAILEVQGNFNLSVLMSVYLMKYSYSVATLSRHVV